MLEDDIFIIIAFLERRNSLLFVYLPKQIFYIKNGTKD